MKKSSILNEATWIKLTPKEIIFNQLCQPIRNMNEKLDELSNLTQNLENTS